MNRHYLSALAGGALAVVALTPGHTAVQKLSVKQTNVSPQKVGGNGATVNVSVNVTEPGTTITKVEAQAAVATNGSGPMVTLTNSKGSQYRGSVRVPVNPSRGTVKGSVSLFVTVSTKTGAQQVKLATLKVGPWNDSAPPPPPPN